MNKKRFANLILFNIFAAVSCSQGELVNRRTDRAHMDLNAQVPPPAVTSVSTAAPSATPNDEGSCVVRDERGALPKGVPSAKVNVGYYPSTCCLVGDLALQDRQCLQFLTPQ